MWVWYVSKLDSDYHGYHDIDLFDQIVGMTCAEGRLRLHGYHQYLFI